MAYRDELLSWNDLNSDELLREEVDGDRLYTVHYTGWDEDGEAWPGTYDAWSGEYGGEIAAFSWIPLCLRAA